MVADPNVVADLHEVVDLHTVADDGVVERTAIDRAVGADLHVVTDRHRAELGDLHEALRGRGEAETVRADHDPGVQDGTPADPDAVVDRDLGVQQRVLADRDGGPDRAARVDDAARADGRTGADRGTRADPHAQTEPRRGVDLRGGVDPRCTGRRGEQGREPLRQPGIRGIGIAHHDPHRRLGGVGRLRRRHDQRAGRTRRGRPRMAPARQERNCIRPGRLERREPHDASRTVADELATDARGNLGDRHGIGQRWMHRGDPTSPR